MATDEGAYDVIVVGAGLYGIQAARYYLEIHPEAKLCILEADDVVGGVWSSKRIYDTFWTQTPLGMAEYSDVPLHPRPPADEQYYGFFPAKYVTSYLEKYIDSHVYEDRSIRDRIRFNTRVINVLKKSDGGPGWKLELQQSDKNDLETPRKRLELSTKKLIDATGLTSCPDIPSLPGQNKFLGLAIHHRSFGQHENAILNDPKNQNICVVGGGKSAADIAYACAKAGKVVSWIIREDGNGPAAFLSAKGRNGYENSNDAFYTRLTSMFLPCVFHPPGWCYELLHRTKLGQWVLGKVWEGVDKGYRKTAGFRTGRGQGMGFDELEPDTPVFWQNDSAGINQRADFFATIAERVHVYRRNIDHLSEHGITLAPKGTAAESKTVEIPVDAMIYCTGWSTASSIFSDEMSSHLGLRVWLDEKGTNLPSKWRDLELAADADVIARFPMLEQTPPHHRSKASQSPFRLYKCMVPLSDARDHSIVCLGKMVVGNNFLAAEVQALWATAYLDGEIQCEESAMASDVAETVTWNSRRYLNKGQLGSYFFFDSVAYTDMLLDQLGLSSHRPRGFWANLHETCFLSNYGSLLEEYKSSRRSQGRFDADLRANRSSHQLKKGS